MENNLQYAKKDYWNERFQAEDNYEWLCEFKHFSQLILPKIRKDDRILHIGCGTSKLSMELYKLGYNNITNVDYSSVLIEACKELYPKMEWICDDITSLDLLADKKFDVVLEKATLEALLVGEKSPWSPSDEALNLLDAVFNAVTRVLTPKALLRNTLWAIEVEEFGETFHFFIYSCRIGETTSPELRDRFLHIAPEWLRVVSQ